MRTISKAKSPVTAVFIASFLVWTSAAKSQEIKYDYKGKLGIIGIATTAEAYEGGKKVADAKALDILKKESGPNHLLVEETHYSTGGDVTYKGQIEFRFGGLGGAVKVAEKPVSGKKVRDYFSSWPSGH